MAHIQEIKRGKRKYYELVESYRENGRVKTKRTYLGINMPIRRWRGWTNLSQETIDWLKRRPKTQSTKIHKPNGKYRTIVIDPPWPMKKIDFQARAKEGSVAYDTLTLKQIKDSRVKVPIRQLADKTGCHIFLWTTQKFLQPAFEILAAWGFKHIFTMVWHKNHGMQPFNLPQFNCEFVLFGRRGDISFIETKDFPTCFYAVKREHSRKPDEFYNLVRRVSPEPRLDMFSREKREGFDQFGNEVSNFSG